MEKLAIVHKVWRQAKTISPLVWHATHHSGLVGYCPGTSLGAIGEGPVDVFGGTLNMLLGCAAYVNLYPLLKESVLIWRIFEKVIPPHLLGVNHWLLAPGMFRWLAYWERPA